MPLTSGSLPGRPPAVRRCFEAGQQAWDGLQPVFADSVVGIQPVFADRVGASIPARAAEYYLVKTCYRGVANLAIDPSQTLRHML